MKGPILSRIARRRFAGLIAVLAAAATIAVFTLRGGGPKLPYHDSFSANKAEEWSAYGGAWQLAGGTVFNRSDERGAKLVTGSPTWSNYRIQSDLEMLGHAGDVGLILRVGDEETGIDSYNGYYVGLRSNDSALVIGRADHGWLEAHPVPVPGGVEPSVWYRLEVVAVGCRIGAVATNLQTGQSAWGAFEENPCVAGGKIGLRSMGTGGAWRHISVTPTTEADLKSIMAHAGAVEYLKYPESEAEYYNMRRFDFGKTYFPVHGHQKTILALMQEVPRQPVRPLVSLAPIESVRSMITPDATVRVRGVVTLANPVYIQDSSGGIQLDSKAQLPLNLGDEIEVTGRIVLSGYRHDLEATTVRLLWDRTPTVPLSISSTQAASGAFSSSLVEIRGYIRSITRESDGTLRLRLDDESQSFAAVVPTPLSSSAYRNWQPGSWLSVHGICVIGENFAKQSAAFTVLTRSSDDIEVLAGPPWWSAPRLLRLLIAAFVLMFVGILLYLKIERWKMRGIMDERERLAHEMHDTLAQSFAGVSFHLQGVRNRMRNLALVERADLLEKLDTACSLVAQTHSETSANIAALHPDADGGVDLLVALERYAAPMLDADNVPMEIRRSGVVREISLPVRDALFQVGREAITNVVRHSRSEKLSLCLRYEPRTVALEVRDNGVGFSCDTEAGFGISAMRRRCERIDADLQIASAPGQGTTVTITSPYGRRHTVSEWFRQTWNRLLSFRRVAPPGEDDAVEERNV
ncbi:MAG TPA: ATP-binding protein [Terracidiphilus sp.]|nr:ATP-binding protein [Terracidiphilus sp.]